ncbi:unnamed protein product [Calypogeia fissa]
MTLAVGVGTMSQRLVAMASSSQLLTGGLNAALPFKLKCPTANFEFQHKQRHLQVERQSLMVCASSTGGRELYQPFRPPPSSVSSTPAGAATIEQQLEILRERQGLWYVYATVIPSLARAGFTPSEIDEATGLTGHEQNQLVVGAQVRDSLMSTNMDKELVAWFDVGGAERLYELRTLSAQERKAAAQDVIERNMDAKLVRDLARAMKDFPRRKNAEGWTCFTTAPGDCLAFALYRQSKETTSDTEAESILNKALEFAVTEKARAKILSALGQGEEEAEVEPEIAKVKVLVMRLDFEKIPVVLPVADFSANAFDEAPSIPAVAPGSSGNFNVSKTDTPWTSWIAIPSWRPITYAKFPVALLVPDATVLPKNTGIELRKAPILVVVDKGDREIVEDSFFLVALSEGSLTLQSGSKISPGKTVLGKVLIALKPPLPIDPNFNTDWE